MALRTAPHRPAQRATRDHAQPDAPHHGPQKGVVSEAGAEHTVLLRAARTALRPASLLVHFKHAPEGPLGGHHPPGPPGRILLHEPPGSLTRPCVGSQQAERPADSCLSVLLHQPPPPLRRAKRRHLPKSLHLPALRASHVTFSPAPHPDQLCLSPRPPPAMASPRSCLCPVFRHRLL